MKCVCGFESEDSNEIAAHKRICMSGGTADIRAVVEAFAETVEAACAAHKNQYKGGQQVSFHGDFCPGSIGPSGLVRLKWWIRELKFALER